jgi:hypothetical protein
MFEELINETTTFWSQDQFVNLENSNVQGVNLKFTFVPRCADFVLIYGSDIVGQFGFAANIDFKEDMPHGKSN